MPLAPIITPRKGVSWIKNLDLSISIWRPIAWSAAKT